MTDMAALEEDLRATRDALRQAELLADPTLYEQAQKLRNEVLQVQAREAKVQTRARELEAQALELQTALEESRRDNVVAKAHWKVADASNDEALAETRKLKRRQAEARADACAALANLSNLREDNRALRIKACERALDAHNEQARTQSLTRALKHALKQRDTLAAKAHALTRAVDEAVSVAGKVRDERNHLRTQLTAAREHAAGLTSDLEAARREIAHLESQQPTIAQILEQHQRSITENIEAMMRRQQLASADPVPRAVAALSEQVAPASEADAALVTDFADQESVASSVVNATPEQDDDPVPPASENEPLEISESPKARQRPQSPTEEKLPTGRAANKSAPIAKTKRGNPAPKDRKPTKPRARKPAVAAEDMSGDGIDSGSETVNVKAPTPRKRSARAAKEPSAAEQVELSSDDEGGETTSKTKTPTPKKRPARAAKQPSASEEDEVSAVDEGEGAPKTTPTPKKRQVRAARKITAVEDDDLGDGNSESLTELAKAKTPTPKKRAAKTAALGEQVDASDVDGEIVPEASTPTPRKSLARAAQKTTKADQDEEGSDSESSRAKPSRARTPNKRSTRAVRKPAVIDDESSAEESENEGRAPTAKKRATRAAAKKPAKAKEDDAMSDDEVDPSPAKAARRKSPAPTKRPTRAAARKAEQEDLSSDDDDDEVTPSPAKAARRKSPAPTKRPRRAAARKAEQEESSSSSSSDDDDDAIPEFSDAVPTPVRRPRRGARKQDADGAHDELLDEDASPAKTTSRPHRPAQDSSSDDSDDSDDETVRSRFKKNAAQGRRVAAVSTRAEAGAKRTRATRAATTKENPTARAKKRSRVNAGEHKALFNFMDSALAPKLKSK